MKTVIEQLRYLKTVDELKKSFKGNYDIFELPRLYLDMSIKMRIFLGVRVGKI